MTVTSLPELYRSKLQQIYDAEHQTLAIFPRLIQQATNDDLRSGLEAHRQQTEDQVRRLEGVFREAGEPAQRTTCMSMRALLQEAAEQLTTIQDADTRDAFIIAAQQAVEHHEMAAYGTARSWAQQLGYDDSAVTLQAILDQEGSTDELLSDVAERMVNPEAARSNDVDVTPRAQMADRSASTSGTSARPAARSADTDARA